MIVSRTRLLDSMQEVDAAEWNSLAGSAQPFLRHEFLLSLEESGCADARSGWHPRHAVLEDRAGRLLAALPLYRKDHSRGEFVFDFAWGNAYAQYGIPYYPKLVSAIPFTPVTGPRLLVRPGADREPLAPALLRVVGEYARSEGLSSWHVLFPASGDREALSAAGLIERRDCQFHWFNRGYGCFEEFLATFTAEKRKKARRERRRVAEAGIEFDTRFGGDMADGLWDTVYQFYADTFHRHGHEPYLNLRFFKLLAGRMPERLMLKIARRGATPIALAIFFVGENALYGRYWGAAGSYHSLHFETCYYQGIEYCIEHGLGSFEPGTQGEHKVPRGFVPTLTSSAHYITDPRFAAAIRDFAMREARGVEHYAAAVSQHVPYHRTAEEELHL